MEKIEERTDYCGNITEKYIGQDVNLYGWVQRVRNLGNLVFIDLRDREGLVQIVVNKDSGKELMDIADSLGLTKTRIQQIRRAALAQMKNL